MGRKRKPMVGVRYNMLTVISDAGCIDKWKAPLYVCECDCGNNRLMSRRQLFESTSCGCTRKCKHGLSESSTYKSWASMLSRCTNENNDRWKDYGGRGIKVCDRWVEKGAGFINFLGDMGEKPTKEHSIDRIDNNGNYEVSNCRWATDYEQTRNTRANRILTYNGITMCATDWSEKSGIHKNTLLKRLDMGWTIEQVLETPLRKHQRRNV